MRDDWRILAACVGQENLFLPPGREFNKPGPVSGESKRAAWDRQQEAKTICEGCPVLDDCFEYAVRLQPDIGIWAGASAHQLTRGVRMGDILDLERIRAARRRREVDAHATVATT